MTININAERTQRFSDILPTFPRGHLIDKGMCGNGMTTALIRDALSSGIKTVLAFPSRFLAEQKASLYHDDNRVLLCCGGTPWRDADLGQKSLILTTYNTACALTDERRIDTGEWDLFIDEYHKCAEDKSFRNDVLLRLGKIATRFRSFGAGTATPPRFVPLFLSGLPKIKITYKQKPLHLYNVIPCKPSEAFAEILGAIKSSEMPMRIFCNSVADIIQLIESAGLPPDQAGIICSKHSPATKQPNLKPYIFLANKPMPKYLFLTSSGFDGIDLLDERAHTIICAFGHLANTMLDPRTMVAQIAGRQRLPDFWSKNQPIDVYLLTIPSGDHRITDGQFNGFLGQQVDAVRPLVSAYNQMLVDKTITKQMACEYMAVNSLDESVYQSKKISWHGAVFFDYEDGQLDIDHDYVSARVAAHNLRHTVYGSIHSFCSHLDAKFEIGKRKTDESFSGKKSTFKSLIKRHLDGDVDATNLLAEKYPQSFYWLQDNQMDDKLLALPTSKIHLMAKLDGGMPALQALRDEIGGIVLGRSDAIDGWVNRQILWDDIKHFCDGMQCPPINPSKIISFAARPDGRALQKMINGERHILPMTISNLSEWGEILNVDQIACIEKHYASHIPPRAISN